MCKYIFDRIHEFTTTLVAFKCMAETCWKQPKTKEKGTVDPTDLQATALIIA